MAPKQGCARHPSRACRMIRKQPNDGSQLANL